MEKFLYYCLFSEGYCGVDLMGEKGSNYNFSVVVISEQGEGNVRLEQRVYSNGALNPSRCVLNSELLDAVNAPVDVRNYLIFLEGLNKRLGGNPYGKRIGWTTPILVEQKKQDMTKFLYCI